MNAVEMTEMTVRRASASDALVWSGEHEWWQPFAVGAAEYLSWEAVAHHVREWAVLRMPDVLWTPEYTVALLRADRVFCADHFVGGRWDEAAGRRLSDEVLAREGRQARLMGWSEQPMTCTAVIEEAALRRVVGDHSVMRGQLSFLVEMAGFRSVVLRVVPERSCAQADVDGGFAILEFPDPARYAPMLFAHYPGGVVRTDAVRGVAQAQRRFDAVLAVALPEGDSVEFIEQVMNELYPA